MASHYPRGHVKLLAGCAPCQPFSTYSQGRNARNDKKWPLLYEFARIISEIEPDLVTMENVPDVVKHQVYHDFVSSLKRAGYHVWAEPVYCPDYGTPQKRTRHVLLASILGSIEMIKPTHTPKTYKTVKQTISALPPLKAGKQHPNDPLHKAAGLSELNMERMLASRPGGSWWDWPEKLRADCHRKGTGRSYSGVYARMSWNEPSPTMTTQCYGFGNGRFGHPSQHRAISLREAAMLQTFPKKYRFVMPGDRVELAPIGRMIGNAVPVKLGRAIGRSLTEHINKLKSG